MALPVKFLKSSAMMEDTNTKNSLNSIPPSIIYGISVNQSRDNTAIQMEFRNGLQRHAIPLEMETNLASVYVPLAKWISEQRLQKKKSTLVVGINGAQGSGKSTLTDFLALFLQRVHELSVACISLDDFYKTRQERINLADNVHPLLVTRGVPGTHDTELASRVITSLKNADDTTTTLLPLFDKSTDDRFPPDISPHFIGKPDIILFEGWCIGSDAEDEMALIEPINELERLEDPECKWRTYVNNCLKNTYAKLFEELDVLIFLKIPDMGKVLEWRELQEKKLSALNRQPDNRLMNREQLRRFIMHYERLTQHNWRQLPNRADVVLTIDDHHQFSKIEILNSSISSQLNNQESI